MATVVDKSDVFPNGLLRNLGACHRQSGRKPTNGGAWLEPKGLFKYRVSSYRRGRGVNVQGFLIVIAALCSLSVAADIVDERTGLIKDGAWQLVAAHCGNCHSLQLVTGNRGDRRIWLETIRWMQARQNLWQLDAQTEDPVSYTHLPSPRDSV